MSLVREEVTYLGSGITSDGNEFCFRTCTTSLADYVVNDVIHANTGDVIVM